MGLSNRFNIKSSFQNLGGNIPGLPLPQTGSSVFGNYDDGFIQADISGDVTSTTFWSYQNDAQYNPANGGSLGLSISSIPGSGSVSERDDAAGFDLFARRTMGQLTFLGKPAHWGLQVRFNYTDIDIGNDRSLSLTENRVTDKFPLEGIIPPLAHYTGSFSGPGPLLGTNATRNESLISGGALVTGFRDLDADLFAFSFGPWVEFSPVHRLSIQFEAGLSLAFIDGSYSQSSTTTSSEILANSRSQGSDDDVLLGLYVGTGVSYAINKNWELYTSARYEYLDNFSVKAGDSRAKLSFDGSFSILTGLLFRF